MKSTKRLIFFLYVVLFTATFLGALALMLALFDTVEGQEDGYPGPVGYPGAHLPVVMNGWDDSQPTLTPLPLPTPLPTSTPSTPPTETPCDKCWTCRIVPCYEDCLENCGCFFDEENNWCVPCDTCEGGVRCRD
jgi:hypothetical protein